MAVRYTEEQLEHLTAEVHSLNEKMQLMMEQLVLEKRNRFGRSSEKMEDMQQISFMEVDGTIVFFNEAEAFGYMLNQEKHMRVFLTGGDVPRDNNA